MNHIYEKRQRPDRVPEICRIFDHQLLQINDVGNKKQIDKEKSNIDIVGSTFS